MGIGLAFKQYARFTMADLKRKGELRSKALSGFGRRFHGKRKGELRSKALSGFGRRFH